MATRIITLRQVFAEFSTSDLHRYLFFKGTASKWTLETAVMIDEDNPDDEGANFSKPPKVPVGFDFSVFSSDIAFLVNYVDELCGRANDGFRLQALKYYFDNRRMPPSDWQPNES